MDDAGYVRAVLGEANSGIPISRRTLIEHLESGDFSYRTRKGDEFIMDVSEVESLAEICDETEKMRLRLPIIVSTDPGAGGWKVDGVTETSVMSKILGIKPFREDVLRFYNPHLAELRRKYPTTVAIAFIP